MNWNEWRMKWGMFWLFVVVLVIVVAGCGGKPKLLDPMQENFQPDHLESDCPLHVILEESLGPKCRALRLT